MIFVSWEGSINYITGHFCEPGVNEWIAADREQTAFYEWSSTLDDKDHIEDKDELRRRQVSENIPSGESLDDTFEGAITKWILDAMREDPSIKPEDLNMTNDDLVHAQSGFFLPDEYGRIFHPQKYGHAMIAEAVLRSMNAVKAQSMGQKAATTTLIGCPAATGVASHSGEPDKCYSDAPPDNNGVTFQVDDTNKAIHDYCAKHKTDTIGGGDGIIDTVPNGGDASSSLELRASLANDQTCIDYPNKGAMNFFDCTDNFGAAMNNCKSCDPSQSHKPVLTPYPRRRRHLDQKRRLTNGRLHLVQHPRHKNRSQRSSKPHSPLRARPMQPTPDPNRRRRNPQRCQFNTIHSFSNNARRQRYRYRGPEPHDRRLQESTKDEVEVGRCARDCARGAG